MPKENVYQRTPVDSNCHAIPKQSYWKFSKTCLPISILKRLHGHTRFSTVYKGQSVHIQNKQMPLPLSDYGNTGNFLIFWKEGFWTFAGEVRNLKITKLFITQAAQGLPLQFIPSSVDSVSSRHQDICCRPYICVIDIIWTAFENLSFWNILIPK